MPNKEKSLKEIFADAWKQVFNYDITDYIDVISGDDEDDDDFDVDKFTRNFLLETIARKAGSEEEAHSMVGDQEIRYEHGNDEYDLDISFEVSSGGTYGRPGLHEVYNYHIIMTLNGGKPLEEFESALDAYDETEVGDIWRVEEADDGFALFTALLRADDAETATQKIAELLSLVNHSEAFDELLTAFC